MIECPFEYALTESELAKLGSLSLTWSHTEHMIGNCLKMVLNLSANDTFVMVFPLSLEHRLQRLDQVSKFRALNREVMAAIAELKAIMPAIQYVRNTVVHAVLIDDTRDGTMFHLRSKERSLAKAHIFQSEELTNYAGQVAFSLRYALRFPDWPTDKPTTLPNRPEVPEFLRELIPTRKR